MSYFKITKGLDIPLAGAPNQTVFSSKKTSTVAVLGPPYRNLKPLFQVKEGDRVKLGQPLFQDRRYQAVQYTAPAAGVVERIFRGEKRAFLSLTIKVEADKSSRSNFISFEKFSSSELATLPEEKVRALLLRSGLWTALRTRPFASVPAPDSTPHALFVTAIDTNPLAPDPVRIISKNKSAFKEGLKVLTRLTPGTVHLCKAPGPSATEQQRENLSPIPHGPSERTLNSIFEGPHPAGLAGTHIHFLSPVSLSRTVWYIGYQDVIAVGKLFTTGTLFCERYLSLGGPLVKNPRLIKTTVGANLTELVAGELKKGAEARVISGSVLAGHTARPPVDYLGPFDNQVSVLAEDRQRVFHGFLAPGFNKFSVKNLFVSKLFPKKKLALGTNTNGSHRAIVPIGSYEKVIPLDLEPTFLLRALLAGDLEGIETLGGLELDAEDLALATYVCPGKNDFMQALTENLTAIEKELQ